uniref:Trichome birefringence-like N-terminal domain-containing protein n=1 Tax=Kalanchoe fedtschenkoi TaxID=63787 RepID=A0A7N0T2L4_KALFE
MNRAGPGPSPLVLFPVSMICISALFILFSPSPFKISSNQTLPIDEVQNRAEQNDGEDEDGGMIDKGCDLFNGRWVPDMRGSAYTNWTCPTIPTSKNCFLNGREDRDFVNWRWKPDGCDLPRFDPRLFLRIMRNKKLAFVGDSVARNHMESLLCLLSQEETPEDKYKDSEDRFRTWYFPGHNFTLSVLWTKFLVAEEERTVNGSGTGIFNLHLDRIDPNWGDHLADLDYMVLSDAHWFFRKLYLYRRSNLVGCIYCDEKDVESHSPDFGLRMAFRAALARVSECGECKEGMVVIIRTFSPAHFEGGGWDSGGGCNSTSPRVDVEVEKLLEWAVRSAQVEEAERAGGRRDVRVVDVTRAMLMRPDGHPGSHWDNQWMQGFNDCVHWCMPGPVDVWSDFLLAVVRQNSRSSRS